ncbi:MAG: glycosyltransferase family 39 protein, partial [Chloroflexota bacterium]
DEGLTDLRSSYSLAEILSNRITIQEGVTKDTHPPFYYLLVYFTRQAFGRSDFAFRYPSVLAGLLLIPLLYQFGRRLPLAPFAPYSGLLAAGLAAINPLQIWYAQEARMYTLLALLATAASYVLWRTLNTSHLTNRALFGRLMLYGLLAGLAVYTHYTAVFLVAGQGLFWAWFLWRRGLRRVILGILAAGFLASLPLLPLTLPRLFTGAEANYFYVPPWIMLQDIVHGFGLGLTVDFSQWSIKLLDVGLALVLLAGVLGRVKGSLSSSRFPLHVAFLLVFLLSAVLGLALGSLIKPMYMGARHIMVGSPALFLLLARGLVIVHSPSRRLLPLLAGLVLLAGPAVSLYNLYDDPHYAKDDLRGLIGAIEEQAGNHDLVLYNNAILLAQHEHYRRRLDLPVTALPVYPYWAGPETEQQLAELVSQYRRVWFVSDPPADHRDDDRRVRRWLDDHTLLAGWSNFHGRTMIVEVFTYLTTPYQMALPLDAQPVAIEWPGLPALSGLRLDTPGPAALPTLWLELFWQGQRESPPTGRQLRFVLRGPDGRDWLDNSFPLQPNRPAAWSSSPVVSLAYGLTIPPGAPPGEYELLALPWDKASQAAVGQWQRLTTVTLAPTSQWPLLPDWPFDPAGRLVFGNGLELVGQAQPAGPVRPGHSMVVDLY